MNSVRRVTAIVRLIRPEMVNVMGKGMASVVTLARRVIRTRRAALTRRAMVHRAVTGPRATGPIHRVTPMRRAPARPESSLYAARSQCAPSAA